MKNILLVAKKRRFSRLSPTGHDILAVIDDNTLKSQDIHSKLVAFDSIRLTLQVNIKNMYLSLKNNLLFSGKHDSFNY